VFVLPCLWRRSPLLVGLGCLLLASLRSSSRFVVRVVAAVVRSAHPADIMFALRRVATTQTATVARIAARSFSDASLLTLNFAMPHGAIYTNESVELVRLTSCIGEYGITAGHTPNVSQLAPGLAQIYKTKDAAPDVYFVSGSCGFVCSGLLVVVRSDHHRTPTPVNVGRAGRDALAHSVPGLWALFGSAVIVIYLGWSGPERRRTAHGACELPPRAATIFCHASVFPP
jgi:hypothetical protein